MSEDVNQIIRFLTIGQEKYEDHDIRCLRAMRAYLGLSLTEAQRLSDVSRETISRCERGRRKTYRTTVAAIRNGYMRAIEAPTPKKKSRARKPKAAPE